MLERQFSAAIVRVVCWPVAAAAFSAFFINIASAEIKLGAINRTIAPNGSWATRNLAGELVSNETADVITQKRAAGAECGLADIFVIFNSMEFNGTFSCTATLAVVGTLPLQPMASMCALTPTRP